VAKMVPSPGTPPGINQAAASRACERTGGVEGVSHFWVFVCISVEGQNIKNAIC